VVLDIVVHKPSGLVSLLHVVTVENVKSCSISVKYYIAWILLRSQILVASNHCVINWDACLVCRYKEISVPMRALAVSSFP